MNTTSALRLRLANARRIFVGFLRARGGGSSRNDAEEASLRGEFMIRMHQCWESIGAETLKSGAADNPRTRRDAVVRHIEEWMRTEEEDTRLLVAWRGTDERIRNLLLDEFAAPPRFDIIGFTCER